jgi:RimJ/RimL family protein N-acetyltransferase
LLCTATTERGVICTRCIFIGEQSQRRHGFGRQALTLALKHAFCDLGLERVFFEVLADNQGAIRLYEMVGFEVEALLRKKVLKNGEFTDVLMMGILADGFLSSEPAETVRG